MGNKINLLNNSYEVSRNDNAEAQPMVMSSNTILNHIRSFTLLGSHMSYNSTISNGSNIYRPWSRVSRKRWNERTLVSPMESAKTAWPVSLCESLFLPEFKIRDEINEESFINLGEIARGAFGKVSKIQKIDTGEIFALKVLSKAQIVAGNAISQVKDEVRIQQMVGHHPFIVNLVYFWQNRTKLFIVSNFVDGQELYHYLEKLNKFPEHLVMEYVAEIAFAIDFLHNSGVIYRDLKLENLLIDTRGHIQLIDFGLSKWLKYGGRTTTICGTIAYVAPEVLLGKPYGHAVDWWSLGIIMFCLLNGEFPYSCALIDNGTVQSVPDSECSPAAKDLIKRLLVPEPMERLRSMIGLKRVAFFHKFDFDTCYHMTKDLIVYLKGTVGKVHISCLEHWLSQSNTQNCDLCGFPFRTIRRPKYSVRYSLFYWLFKETDTDFRQGLLTDLLIFFILNPLLIVTVYTCVAIGSYYSNERTYSAPATWTSVAMLVIVIILTFGYYLWVSVAIRIHGRNWYRWWQTHNEVKLLWTPGDAIMPAPSRLVVVETTVL